MTNRIDSTFFGFRSFTEFNKACDKEQNHSVPLEIRNHPKFIIYKRFGAIGERYGEYLARGGAEIPEERAELFGSLEIR